jgi:hypothetical protein
MTTQTDPTYLRYIFDGLESKAIHQENISALPEGLIGIYEEALSQEHNVRDRERFLSFFSTWTLLKKEVCASLVSDLLNWPEQHVIDCLSIYTKWFNSPTSGTYILYHERLRVFLLERISPKQLHFTNKKIISLCQAALNQKKGDEWEIYALEHLPAHLLILAIQDEQYGAVFKKLVYHTGYWNRQVEISKGYDWSKKMLNLAMVWAAKQNTDELIECALNKVDLHHMEQNDAPRIVELVAQNDIDTALQRIEAFGGNDKEGLQRKFTLYMLCLMELTLLDSKDKPFRKTAIEILLNHLDENTPVDHSLLNWNDFFPSYLMFQMACEWVEIEVEHLRVYKRANKWKLDWMIETGLNSELHFQILHECVRGIVDKLAMIQALNAMSKGLANQGKIETQALIMQEALECALVIINESDKNVALKDISIEIAKMGKIEEALECIRFITDNSNASIALMNVSAELDKLGKNEEAVSLLQEALDCANGINDESEKSNVLKHISSEIAKMGMIEKALECAQGVSDESFKISALTEIATEMFSQGKFNEVELLMQDAIASVMVMDMYTKDDTLYNISIELVKQNNLEKSLNCARQIINDYLRCRALNDISTVLTKHNNVELASKVIDEALDCAKGIQIEMVRRSILEDISKVLVQQGKIEDAFLCARVINDPAYKSSALNGIYTEISIRGMYQVVAMEILEDIFIFDGNKPDLDKSQFLENISNKLTKEDKIEQALAVVGTISFDIDKINALNAIYAEQSIKGNTEIAEKVIKNSINCALDLKNLWKDNALNAISLIQAKQGKIEDALICARGISDGYFKSTALAKIANELFNLGMNKDSELMMEEALSCARGTIDIVLKFKALKDISAELAKKGKIEVALSCAREINDEKIKESSLEYISTEFAKQGRIEEAFECTNGIVSATYKSSALLNITTELAKYGAIQESISCAYGIIKESYKITALSNISEELSKNGKIQEAASLMQEAIECARSLSFDFLKNNSLKDIAVKLTNQRIWHLAEQVVLEIPQIAERQDCWKDIGKAQNEMQGGKMALLNISKFQSQEAQLFYLKGWAESIAVDDISNELSYKAIQALMYDSASLEHFLQVYAQHELFFNNPSQEKINRLNKTLNLQWALDIIAQFPKE